MASGPAMAKGGRELALRLLAAILVAFSGISAAHAACGTRDFAIDQLETRYEEQLAARGFDHRSGTLIEIWVDWETQTFTILRTFSNGTACSIASGENWERFSDIPEMGL